MPDDSLSIGLQTAESDIDSGADSDQKFDDLQRGDRRLSRRRKNLGAWGRFKMQGDCWAAFPLAKTVDSFGGEAPLICSL